MLTLTQLRGINACAPAIAAFEARWPEGQAPLHDVMLALAEHPDGVQWWEWLAPRLPILRPVWEEYEADQHLAWEAREAILRPARKAYMAIECPAWEKYEADRLSWEAYLALRRPAQEAYLAIQCPAWEKYEATLRQAIRDVAMNLPPVAA